MLSDNVSTKDKGFQDFTVWGTVGVMGVTMLQFSSVWEGDTLVVDCDHQLTCNRTEERDGDRVTVRLEGWPYPNEIPEVGVQPGTNSILFAIPFKDLPPRFHALHVFADSYIEVTTTSPYGTPPAPPR